MDGAVVAEAAAAIAAAAGAATDAGFLIALSCRVSSEPVVDLGGVPIRVAIT